MVYTVSHRTEYEYHSSVSLAQHLLHLRPRTTERQRIQSFQLTVAPPVADAGSHDDFYGNHVDVISIDLPHESLVVESKFRVEVTPPNWPDPESTPNWEKACNAAPTDLSPGRPLEFIFDSDRVAQSAIFRDYALTSFFAGRPFLSGL